jgi:rod shape determining protein RodA
LTITFFLSVFVNIGMVMGILPVVGMPLPLISYGGTAMVTFLASFGILMSISSHKILFTSLH